MSSTRIQASTRAAVLNLPNSVTFNTGSHTVVTPNYRIISLLLLRNCYFATVIKLPEERRNSGIHSLQTLCRSFTHWKSFKLEDFYHVAALQSGRPYQSCGCVHCRGRFVLYSCSQGCVSVLLSVNRKGPGQRF